jgi:hypothetical protein
MYIYTTDGIHGSHGIAGLVGLLLGALSSGTPYSKNLHAFWGFQVNTEVNDENGRKWLQSVLHEKAKTTYLKFAEANVQADKKLGHRMSSLALLSAPIRNIEIAGLPLVVVHYKSSLDLLTADDYAQCLVLWRKVENDIGTAEYSDRKNKIGHTWNFLMSAEMYDFMFTELNRPVAVGETAVVFAWAMREGRLI